MIEKILAIDIDGVLTIETDGWNYEERTPNYIAIESVKKLYNSYYIKLFTSRYEIDREITTKWLKKYSIPYNELVMNKPKYDYIIDDKAITFENLNNLFKLK